MPDPKLKGSPIQKRTSCRVGTHAFIWAGGAIEMREDWLRCDCGTYTYKEWAEGLEETDA